MLKNIDLNGLSRRERNRVVNRNQILEVAARALAENGYQGSKMTDIAAGSEFSIGGLYKYFPTKQSLFGEVMLQQFGAAVEQLRSEIASQDSWQNQLAVYISHHFRWGLHTNPEFLNMINDIFYRAEISPDQLARWEKLQREISSVLKGVLQRAALDGTGIDPEFGALVVAGTLNSICESSSKGYIKVDPQEYSDRIVAMVAAS